MTDVTLNGIADSTETESVSLTDFAEEVGGAWPNGWYAADIIEGYATQKSGKVFTTEDTVSGKGDSRNLRICFKVTNAKADERTMQESFNYRSSDFTSERLAFIKEARAEYKGVKGRWSDADAQRSSLAIAKIGQLQKALGFSELKVANGGLVAGVFVAQKVDVRLTTDENGYNEINAFAPAGTKTGRKS